MAVGVVAATLLLVACPGAPAPKRVSLLVTWGESGAIVSQAGYPGFLREISVLRAEKQRAPVDATIAAGNYSPGDTAMAKQFARIFVAAANDFDVCAVGPYEINNGLPTLKILADAPCLMSTQAAAGMAGSPIKLVQLRHGNTMAVVTSIPSLKREIGGVRTDPRQFDTALKAARGKAALIVVIAYDIHRNQAVDLLTRHPEIDIVFGRIQPELPREKSASAGRNRQAASRGGTIERVGRGWLADSGSWGVYRLSAELNGGAVDSLDVETISIPSSTEEPPDLQPLKEAYLADRKAMRIDDPMVFGAYSGAKSCEVCHHDQYDRWSDSKHAGAIITLLKSRDEYTVNCLPCHTTGFGEPGGFRNYLGTATFSGVQCEACHGPSLAHMRDAHKRGMKATSVQPPRPTRQTCLKCHTAEWSPHFDYATAVKSLTY
ncbi:MAG: multiheme c-type cytochrome [bacterium]